MRCFRIPGILFFLVWFSVEASAASVKQGAELFNSRACVGCHAIGKQGSATTGPNLAGVTKKRSDAWLLKWIKNPDQMRADPIVKRLEARYPTQMPNLGLSEDDAKSLVLYLKSMDGHS